MHDYKSAYELEKTMIDFEICGRKVGPAHEPLVIAEVGINHEGSLDKAFAMVDACVSAGAEIVKFQCHITEKEMLPTDMTPGEISSEKLWDIIKRCEFTEKEERQIQSYCNEKGIIYLSTPFSREAADRLQTMDVPAFKIGSGECNNYPLLDHVAGLGKPIILSTGMNDLASVIRSVEVIRKHEVPLALLHCTSMYPTPYDSVRLGAISQMRDRFPNLPIGLSDHSMGIWTSLGAVALGACILEKHFTVSRDWSGPDTPISIEPNELGDLIYGAKAIWSARGGQKSVLSEEQPVIEFAYATVVSIAPIHKGEEFSRENIWVKRPGTGSISASQFESIIGLKALSDIPQDNHIAPHDIEGFADV